MTSASDIEDSLWANDYCPVCGEVILQGVCSECGLNLEDWQRHIEHENFLLQHEAQCLDMVYNALDKQGG